MTLKSQVEALMDLRLSPGSELRLGQPLAPYFLENNPTEEGEAMAVRKPGSSKPITEPEGGDFLKPADIGKKGKLAVKIVAVSDGTSQFGEGWNVLVESKLGEHVWTVKENSGNHIRLYKRYKAKWIEKKVTLVVKQHMKKDYVAIED